MTTVLTVLFGLLFFALIMVSVALHEIGHMVPAKLFGVKVPKYFVGFGRTLWSTRRGETEYGIKLIPLGGFVQLLGMYPPRRPGAKDTKLQRLADEARAYEWDTITPDDDGRLFYQKKTWQKIIIMAGGITMNLLIAFFLLWAVSGLYGVWKPTPVLASVQECVITEVREDYTCRPTDPPSPAAKAGLKTGDAIVSFNGATVTNYDQLALLIRNNLDRPVTLVVERNGVQTTLPTVNTIITGVPDPIDPGRRIPAGWLGIRPEYELVKQGPIEVLGQMGEMSTQSVVALVQFPVKVFNVVANMVTGQPRDVYGPISIVGASAVAGEVANLNAPVAEKAVMFASLLASVNLFLALFNLVPLPPLDGGHILGAVYEAVRRWWAKLRGQPDPGPADTAKMLPVAYAMGAFLLLCGVVLIVADVFAPVKLFG